LKQTLAGFLLCLALCGLVCGVGCQRVQSSPASAVVDANRYYAVLLNNGAVYFGKLEGLGSPYPVLHDVYYVQTATDPQTKAVSSILVKRGKEWHGPDRMILNEKGIVFVEPVGDESKVSQLIAASKR
jgi:hypothetical protein